MRFKSGDNIYSNAIVHITKVSRLKYYSLELQDHFRQPYFSIQQRQRVTLAAKCYEDD